MVRAPPKTLVRSSCLGIQSRVERALRSDHHLFWCCFSQRDAEAMACEDRIAVRHEPRRKSPLHAPPVWIAQQCLGTGRYPHRSHHYRMGDANNMAPCSLDRMDAGALRIVGIVRVHVAGEHCLAQ